MVAIDTNVLVRLLTGDDPSQYASSKALFETHAIFIPITVLLEAEWVLRAAFELSPSQINDALRRVLGLPNVTVADAPRIAQALSWHQQGVDFADALHLALSQSHDRLKTFDAAFIRKAATLTACRVERP